MVTCCQCEGIERQFGREKAAKELRRFRRHGPNRTTQLLIEQLRNEGVDGASILDVGGGVGAIHHLLLDAGSGHAVQVDVSPEYIEVAREEAARRHHADRVRFVHGDLVELAPQLENADVVTLDRVICCYPEMEPLVARSAEKARRLYGAVYPRESWWVRFFIVLLNSMLRLRRSSFRSYFHPPRAIDAVLRQHGFDRRSLRRTLVWEVAVYARSTTP